VTAGLTEDALWLQDTWQLRRVSLCALAGVEARRGGAELVLTARPEAQAQDLQLRFARAAEGQFWCRELAALIQVAPPDAPPAEGRVPEGVALLRQVPNVPHVVLARVEETSRSARQAHRGAQLRAGMRGADALVGVTCHKLHDTEGGARHVTGLAIRVEEADRDRLRRLWYAEEVRALVDRSLRLLALLMALLLAVNVFCIGVSRFHPATGETTAQALVSTAWGLGLAYGWPLAFLLLVRVLRWPQLLRTVGIAVLAATMGRMVVLCLGHLLAVGSAGAGLTRTSLWMLLDPIDWALAIAGAFLCARAWRLRRDARDILPTPMQMVSPARKAWARGLLAATGTYAVVLLGFAGYYSHQTAAHLLQPGVDPVREHQALLALNEGQARAEADDLAGAEQSWRRSLRLWEELTATRAAPAAYRANLAVTLNSLGWLSQRRGWEKEAEKFYARAVALADELADAEVDEQVRDVLAGAREALADLRSARQGRLLDEKDEAGVRKYEQAQVKTEQGAAEAEGLFREAIALWEEVLPQATAKPYRKHAVARLATAYLTLAEVQQQLGKRGPAEASLTRAIEYGEKAVALDPQRPLPEHNLKVARERLAGLREQAMQEEVDRLCEQRRYADAVARYLRSIQEAEEQHRSGKDRDQAAQRLAYRLDRLAWFLAHCPDQAVRDAKSAARHASRATTLQPDVAGYWFTLAMVQYRNRDWRGSLASLEKVKAKEGGFDASSFLLAGMNRHQLREPAEARAALRNARGWMQVQERKAEGNAFLRFQFELMRERIEPLRQEAEKLIEGKGERVSQLRLAAPYSRG
jgi:hypothetical protein